VKAFHSFKALALFKASLIYFIEESKKLQKRVQRFAGTFINYIVCIEVLNERCVGKISLRFSRMEMFQKSAFF
jgi:hypothetical protein